MRSNRLGSQVELTLVGRRFQPHSRVDEACRRWRWFETLSHRQVLDVMMESDVLVLPSLGEGFGLVVTEALACGLPVIVTPNVGASDLVHDGQEGFVVPVCSADAIAERLILSTATGSYWLRCRATRRPPRQRNSWASYRANYADTVRAVVMVLVANAKSGKTPPTKCRC